MVGAVTDTVEVEVWLPNDLTHPRDALCHELIRRNIRVRHLRLPIMRRANRNPRGLIAFWNDPLRCFANSEPHGRTASIARPAPLSCALPSPDWPVFPESSAIPRRSGREPTGTCSPAQRWRANAAGDIQRGGGIHAAPPAEAGRRRTERHARASARRLLGRPVGRTSVPGGEPLERMEGAPHSSHRLGPGGSTRSARGPRRRPPSGESVDVPALVSALAQPGSVSVIGEVPDPSSISSRRTSSSCPPIDRNHSAWSRSKPLPVVDRSSRVPAVDCWTSSPRVSMGGCSHPATRCTGGPAVLAHPRASRSRWRARPSDL